MRPTWRNAVILVAALSVGSGLHPVDAAAGAAEDEHAAEMAIESRDAAAKSIDVGVPKVYDDSLLQQMLNSAMSRLGTLQAIDQGALVVASVRPTVPRKA